MNRFEPIAVSALSRRTEDGQLISLKASHGLEMANGKSKLLCGLVCCWQGEAIDLLLPARGHPYRATIEQELVGERHLKVVKAPWIAFKSFSHILR